MANGRYIACSHVATGRRDRRPRFLWSFGNYRFYGSHPGWCRIPLAKTSVLNFVGVAPVPSALARRDKRRWAADAAPRCYAALSDSLNATTLGLN